MFGFKRIWQELQRHGRNIATINDEMGAVQEHTKHIPMMRNNIRWLTWLVCAIFVGVIVGLLQQFLGI